jgi:hypothetical protein
MTEKTIRNLSIALFVALLTWGVATFVIYLGIPVHGLVYLEQDAAATVNAACGNATTTGVYFCRGMELVFPFIGGLYRTSTPLHPYIVLSVIVFVLLLLRAGLVIGRFEFSLRLRPVYFIGAFVLAVWLIGTTLSLGSLERKDSNGAAAFRRFYEPTSQVYASVGDQALKELQKNYHDLLDRGCLSQIGELEGKNTKVYTLSELCIQESMISRVGMQMMLLAILLLNFLVAGRLILRALRFTLEHPLAEFIFSLGIGTFAVVVALWFLAVAGMFHATILQIVFFGLPIMAFPQTWYWLKSAWQRTWHVHVSGIHPLVFLTWLLVSYLALNFLNVVRPFPIGWDDLGSYLNRPHLLASYGAFIPSMASFQWEYLAAMAYGLFGLESVTGSTFAMIINWSAGLIAVLATYACGRMFLGERGGILAAICYYFLPMTGHFSFADMKIDNAAYFTSALGILAACIFLFGERANDHDNSLQRDWRFLVLSGFLLSFSFAIKPTAILAVFLVAEVVAGTFFGALGFTGVAIGSFALLEKFAPFHVFDVLVKVGWAGALDAKTVNTVAILSFVTVGLILLILGIMRHRAHVRSAAMNAAILFAAMAAAALPWIVNNEISNPNFSVANALKYNDTLKPVVSYLQKDEAVKMTSVPADRLRALPPELKLNPDDPACKTSAVAEELDRYWGFGEGWSHYFTLPWRVVMNIDAVGYYVTLMPALLLVPLVLLLPFFWLPGSRWLRLLTVASFVFLAQWAFTANGVIWYGIAMFLVFALILETMALRAPDPLNRWLMGILLGCSIMVCLMNRLWQFDVQRNLFEYPLGKSNADTIREVTIPYYDDIRDSVVQRHETMPDRPYTFRMGTFISYFIPRNIEILPLADNQVQFFNCINQERDHQRTLKRLQALGFNSMTSTGFTVGTSTTVNTNGITYEWVAYGNATSPEKPAGAADFMIGSHTGML